MVSIKLQSPDCKELTWPHTQAELNSFSLSPSLKLVTPNISHTPGKMLQLPWKCGRLQFVINRVRSRCFCWSTQQQQQRRTRLASRCSVPWTQRFATNGKFALSQSFAKPNTASTRSRAVGWGNCQQLMYGSWPQRWTRGHKQDTEQVKYSHSFTTTNKINTVH